MEQAWRTILVVLLAVLVSLNVPETRAELYTALVHMENLVSTEADLSESLQRYVAAEEARLNRIKMLARTVGNISSEATADVAKYLGHPVNAYRLLRRFVSDWREVEDLLNEPSNNEKDFLMTLDERRPLFPTSDDVSGAATALMRLQHTYALSAADIVDGQIPGDQKEPMAAADCFYLGTIAYEATNYKRTKDWMEQTVRKIGEEDNGDIDLATVYDYLAFAEYKLGNVRKALKLTRELLAMDPDHPRAASNIRHYEEISAEENRQKRGETGNDVPSEEKKKKRTKKDELADLDEWERERRQYENLCREPVPMKKSLKKRLKCYYTTGKRHPRLILRPVKVEVAFIKPTILIFRDVLNEPEMNRLKELAYSRLNRATAFNSAEGKYLPADYRISKSSWLGPEIDDTGTIQAIDNRIEAMTGLSMETAEQLQVVNYGIGGQYEPHFDYARKGEEAFSHAEGGNRIATVLFYMSDVEAGGATVFPKVGARIIPSKGDASFWYNLLPSGDGDGLTRHAGCPVLSGTKWVCNKWIHERGQEFRKKCKINRDENWDIHIPENNY